MPAAALAGREGSFRDPQLKRLIIRPGAIGDCIVSLPALEHLCTEDTEIWVSTANVPLIRFAQRVRSISATGLDLVGLPGVSAPVLANLERFDSVVSWYGTNRPEFRSAVSHLPFVFHAALPSGGQHATDFYLEQVNGRPGLSPRIDCPRRDEGFIAIHPFSGSAAKNWPIEKFRRLASRLPEPVRFSAGPEEELDGAVRYDSLYDLGCWLASARVYVGNDSGISHLAAAVGTPVVAIFRNSDPAIWAPRGPKVVVIQGDPEVDAVLRAVESIC